MPKSATAHPTGPKVRPATQAVAALPLFNDRGSVAPDGFVACASCHDPHADSIKRPSMLRVDAPTSDLCATCHTANVLMATGPHDPRGKNAFPLKGPTDDLCTSCHRPHGDDPAAQGFAFIPAAGLPGADGACVACHPKQTWTGEDSPTLGRSLHPRPVPASHASESSGLPLLDADGKNAKSIGCKTCHNPHARPHTPKLMRIDAGASATTLCVRCHNAAEPLSRSMHAADALQTSDAPPVQTCGPCHATHAVEGSQKRLLWSAKATGWDTSDSDQRCLSCHNSNLPRRRILVQHPADPVKTLPWSTTRPATRPVSTEIHCATCHAPHGDPSAHAIADLNARRANKPMLRPNTAAQCAYCHGPNAPRLLLYWHTTSARQRGSPF
jgi:predicted CXXCH cytochrome family protein